MTRAVLGIDIGTSSARCLLVSEDGAVLATAEYAYDLLHPHQSWAVQNPGDWWRAFVETVSSTAEIAKQKGISVAGLAISGQQAGLVAVDQSGAAIGNGILWCDNRSDNQARVLQSASAAKGEQLRYGGPVTGAQWAAKRAWQQEQGIDAPPKIMGVKDYVRSKLCPRVHVTDPVEASVSGFFDVDSGSWDNERVTELGLSVAALPDVALGDHVVGHLEPTIAGSLGLPSGIPVAVGIGDCGAAGLGVGVVESGAEYLGFGSSGITFRVQNEYAPDPRLRTRTCRYVADTSWFTMGVVQTLGLSWAWWRDALVSSAGQPIDHARLEALCAQSEPGSRGLVFLPYLMGDQTPHMDGRIRASFVGLDISHTGADMARAVLEGMAFAMYDAYRVLPGKPGQGALTATGKAVDNRLWVDTLASLFDRPLRSVEVHEGSAYGAAMLAQAASDQVPVEQVSKRWVTYEEDVVEPDQSIGGQLRSAYENYRAAFPAAGLISPGTSA